jgi:hypothetical protein
VGNSSALLRQITAKTAERNTSRFQGFKVSELPMSGVASETPATIAAETAALLFETLKPETLKPSYGFHWPM